MPPQDLTRLRVRRLCEPRIRLPHLRGLLRGAIGRGIGREAVSAELAVEVDFDGADVRGADGDVGEEAPAPAAEEYDALVEGEEAGERALEVGGDAVEFAGEVAALFDDPGGGRVEAVVVPGGEVDDDVVECCGAFGGGGEEAGFATVA